MTFDCFFTQYLFSSMTILAISSILGRKDASADRDSLEEASRLLKELGEAGNCVAQEYCHHVDAIGAALLDHATVTVGPQAMLFPEPAAMTAVFHSRPPQNLSPGVVSTTNIPWTDSSLQTLLSQPPLDMHFLEDAVGDRYLQGLYQPEANYET